MACPLSICVVTALGLSDTEVLVNNSDEHLQHNNYRSFWLAIVIELARKVDINAQPEFAKKNHPTMKRTTTRNRSDGSSATTEL